MPGDHIIPLIPFRDVYEERKAQLQKWGVQHHPDVRLDRFGKEDSTVRHEYDGRSIAWKLFNDEVKTPSWDGILLEEVYEALSEEDPKRLRAELVQVAAVAVAWIEDLDRRT